MNWRYILIGLFGVLLIVDGALLFWVKSFISKATETVSIQVEKPETAAKVKEKFEQAGMLVKVEDNQDIQKKIPKGMKVFWYNKDVGQLAPMLETLKHDKIQGGKIKGNELIFGVYNTPKEAQAALKKVEKYGFRVDENLIMKPAKGSIVTIQTDDKGVSDIKATIEGDFKGQLRKEDVTVTSKT